MWKIILMVMSHICDNPTFGVENLRCSWLPMCYSMLQYPLLRFNNTKKLFLFFKNLNQKIILVIYFVCNGMVLVHVVNMNARTSNYNLITFGLICNISWWTEFSRVYRMPVSVCMLDSKSGSLKTIAEYGEGYGKEKAIHVLYHGYGHYDALRNQ